MLRKETLSDGFQVTFAGSLLSGEDVPGVLVLPPNAAQVLEVRVATVDDESGLRVHCVHCVHYLSELSGSSF
jgi:hypothetical protein